MCVRVAGARLEAAVEEPLSSSPSSGNADAFMANAGSSELLQVGSPTSCFATERLLSLQVDR